MNTYREKIKVPCEEARRIKEALTRRPKTPEECFATHEEIRHEVEFDNGISACIKLCGVWVDTDNFDVDDDNIPFTEGTLIKDGVKVVVSEASDVYFGEWHFLYADDEYVVTVEEDSNPPSLCDIPDSELLRELIKRGYGISMPDIYTKEKVYCVQNSRRGSLRLIVIAFDNNVSHERKRCLHCPIEHALR